MLPLVPQAAPSVAEPALPDAKGYQGAPDEKELAKRFKKRLKFFSEQMKRDHVPRWKKNREYVDGTEGDDGERGLVRVNLTASVVNTIQPNIYAKAPEASVQPQEQLTPTDYEGLKRFSRTLELALNRYAVRDSFLKARGKEAVRSSLTCTTGWLKVIYQRDVREDPLVRNRINDAQDNIQRIERLAQETQDEAQCADYEAKLAELRNMVQGLQSQLEVVQSDGIVIDNVLPEHIVILDNSVRTIDEYAQAGAIAHGVFMTVGAYKAQFRDAQPPKDATRFGQDGASEDEQHAGRKVNIDPDDELVLVWEIWSKDDLTVYTLCDGADEFCRAPYQPQTLGRQWYPLFPLQLWRVTGKLYPRSLVDNLRELVDEYNTRRTNAAEHRRKNIPVRLINKSSGIGDDEIARINGRGIDTDIIGVSADPNSPLQNQLGHLPEIPYNPAMYDTSDILRDIEMVSGAQDASRGGVNQAKTATEAEIMAMGMQSRTADQLDAIEDWLTNILEYAAQLLLLNKSEVDIKRAFGPEAVWPQLQRKDVFEMVTVTIRAGSTAKPNKMRERDQWLQFLPQLQQAISMIGELRTAGNDELADGMVKMVDETLRRFDERMSVNEFLPQPEEGEEDPRDMLKAATAKIEQMVAEAQKALDERERAVRDGETALNLERVKFDADKTVAANEASIAAREVQLTAKEQAANVIREVTKIVDRYSQTVNQALQKVEASELPGDEALVTEVEAVVAPALDAIEQSHGGAPML